MNAKFRGGIVLGAWVRIGLIRLIGLIGLIIIKFVEGDWDLWGLGLVEIPGQFRCNGHCGLLRDCSFGVCGFRC